MRLVVLILISLTFFLALPSIHTASAASSPAVYLSRSRSKLSVYLTFSNLSKVSQIEYMLTYDSSKGKQGAAGTIRVPFKKKQVFRSILLGTCSKNVCTYHSDVKNINLNVNFKTRSGDSIALEKNL